MNCKTRWTSIIARSSPSSRRTLIMQASPSAYSPARMNCSRFASSTVGSTPAHPFLLEFQVRSLPEFDFDGSRSRILSGWQFCHREEVRKHQPGVRIRLMSVGRYFDRAIAFYRKERWPSPLASLLAQTLECSRRLGATREYIEQGCASGLPLERVANYPPALELLAVSTDERQCEALQANLWQALLAPSTLSLPPEPSAVVIFSPTPLSA